MQLNDRQLDASWFWSCRLAWLFLESSGSHYLVFSICSFVVPLSTVSAVCFFFMCSLRIIPSISFPSIWYPGVKMMFLVLQHPWWGPELLCHTVSVCKAEDYVFRLQDNLEINSFPQGAFWEHYVLIVHSPASNWFYCLLCEDEQFSYFKVNPLW